jgi:hypothetical protein
MGYKILGFVVWQVGKWYVRRRFPEAPRILTWAGLGAFLLVTVLAGARAAQRRRLPSE